MSALLLAAPAFAQEGEKSPADSTVGWVFRWLNFALVFGGIAYLLVKKGAPVFRKRTEEIANSIAEAARMREAASEKKSEAEAKLAGLESEVAGLRVEARRDSAAEAERIRGLTGEELKKIERAAQEEIAAAERAARLELKTWTGRRAVDRAEKMVTEQLTPQTEAALVEGFVSELRERVN